MEKELKTLTDLELEAERLLHTLISHDNRATLLTLSGELGTGKTTFVQAIARALGVTDVIVSPTFVLMKRYAVAVRSSFSTLVHIDAYRLKEAADLASLRFAELLTVPHTLICLEWPERVEDALPKEHVALTLSYREKEGRHISYEEKR